MGYILFNSNNKMRGQGRRREGGNDWGYKVKEDFKRNIDKSQSIDL